MRLDSCVIFFTLAAGAQTQNVNFYSPEKEAALGAALAKEVLRSTKPIETGAIRDYVSSMGQQLAAQLSGTEFTWTFTPVVDASGGRTHEPVALPGGFVFVSAKLMLDAGNEAEFAGMLAHSIAHVSERHGTRMATRGETANLSSIPLIFIGGWSGVGDRDSVLIPAGFLKFHQTFEFDADRLAVRLMAGAGYDPNALLRYIDRMQPARTDAPPARATMPPHDIRIAALEEAIRALPPAIYSSPNDEFLEIQQEIRRLMPAREDEPPRLRRPPSLIHQ